MLKPNYKSKIESRSDLLTLLTEACELEHGLACAYLYAGFSLKQDLDEGGMSWEQLHKVKKWAAQLYLVASQEMFHLSQAWNLLTALGGVPYYFRPNFPQSSKYYPMGLPLSLDAFSEKTIKRFIMYELPKKLDEKKYLKGELGYVSEDLYDYKTVGELYEMIAGGIEYLATREDLFIGNVSLQMGTEEIDFPEIVKVTDRQSAITAIHRIVEQGEGNDIQHDDCHYSIFKQLLEEYTEEKMVSGNAFIPVRNVISNPVVNIKGDYRNNRGNVITDALSAEVADIFDDLYNLMLRILQFTFSAPGQSAETKKKLTKFSIAIMPMVIKPLGDSLMLLPSGRLNPGKMAGPAFSMSRHILLPCDEEVALKVISGRFNELVCRLQQTIAADGSPAQLCAALKNAIHLKNYIS